MKYEDLKDTFYLVEANSFETLCHWREFHKDGRYTFEQDGMGFTKHIGKFGGMPVVICLFRYKIDGHWVLFYEATSQVVDHRMINKWLDEHVLTHCPSIEGRVHHCNSMNFGNCLLAIDRVNGVR